MLKIALLQLAGYGLDVAANLAKGERFCREAKKLGADIVLFPEMWNIGYTFPDPGDPAGKEKWLAGATAPDGEFVLHFKKLAKELDLAIALTYLESWPGQPRNSVSLIDRHGQILFTYAKVHTCDFDQEAAFTPGDKFWVANLETARGTSKAVCLV